MRWLGVDPRMDPLRDDPRFSSLVERMKLPAVIVGRTPEPL